MDLPRVGAYTLLERLGEGSMGTVWRARPAWSRVDVAIKVLRSHDLGARARRLVDAELRATAALDHRHVITLLDAGRSTADDAALDGIEVDDPWLVTELADGDLTRWIGRIRWGRWLEVMDQILDGLAHAHARGILHGDLKPANILVRDQDPRIADFGLATWTARPRRSRAGTPSFMAPEIIQGRTTNVGAWTDLYAVGCLGWTLLTGRPPFERTSVEATLKAHVLDPLPEPPADLVPPDAAAWLGVLLARAPTARFQTAADARSALATLGTGGRSLRPGSPDGAGSTSTWRSGQFDGDVPEGGVADAGDAPVVPAGPMPPWRSDRAPRAPIPRHGARLSEVGLRTLPLVGRDALQDTLWSDLAEVVEHGALRRRVVWGPRGVGVSRLATWVAERAYELGVAWPLEARVSSSGDLRIAGRTHLPRFPSARTDLAETVWTAARWVRRGQRPAVVVVPRLSDDLWRAFETAWQAADAAARVPVLLLRAADADDGPDALEVTPLDPADTAFLVHQLLDLDASVVQRVVSVSEGRPGVVLEVVAHWVARGEVRPGPDGRWVASASLSLPDGVEQVAADRAEDRLRGLGPTEREAVQLVSLIEPWDPVVWRAVAAELGLDPDPVWLEPLVAEPAHLDWVRARVSRARRARALHARIARAAAAAPDVGADAVVWHRWQAGELDAAAPLLSAASGAVDAGRSGHALRILRHVEPHLAAVEAHAPGTTARWHHLQAEVAFRAGRSQAAAQWAAQAQHHLVPGAAPPPMTVALLRASIAALTWDGFEDRLAEVRALAGDGPLFPTHAFLEVTGRVQVGDLLGAYARLEAETGPWLQMAGWYRATRAQVAALVGRIDEGLGLARWALLHEVRDGQPWRVPFRQIALGIVLCEAGRLDEAERVLRLAVEGCEAQGNAHGVRNATHGMVRCLLRRTEPARAEAVARRAIRLSEVLGVPVHDLRILLADAELRVGAHADWQEPLGSLQRSLDGLGVHLGHLDALIAEVAAKAFPADWAATQTRLEETVAWGGAFDTLAAESVVRAAAALRQAGRHTDAARARAYAAERLPR